MELLGYQIDTTIEWIAFAVLVGLCVALYFSLIWFIQRYTTGMVGGFLLLLSGFAMVMLPAYQMIWSELTYAQGILCVITILVGCVSLLVGAFKLMNFSDF